MDLLTPMIKKRSKIAASTPRFHRDRYAPWRVELRDDVLRPRPTRPRPVLPDLKPVEDLRHDTKDKTFRTRSGRDARIETRPQGQVQKSGLSTPVWTYFQKPHRVLVCVRRHARRGVLFALRKVGKGRKASSFHRWTEKSYIRCK